MTHQAIIEKTVQIINQLPTEKAEEISDFAAFLLTKYEEQILTNGIQKLASESKAFEFLKDDEDLYTVNDVKERFDDENF